MYTYLDHSVRDDIYRVNLLKSIKENYGIIATGIKPAKRGFHGETWIIYSNVESYFVKIVYSSPHKVIYKQSMPIIYYLNCSGLQCVSRIVRTIDNKYYIDYYEGILAIFDYVEGENSYNYPLSALFDSIGQIYSTPTMNLEIEVEQFNPIDSVDFFASFGTIQVVQDNQALIERCFRRLYAFSERCKHNMNDFYITHGDAGANVMVNGNQITIVDWDYPMLAPPERDAWVYLGCDANMALFTDALEKYGIIYTLKPERMAYYCYYSYLYYLKENLLYYQSVRDENISKKVLKTIHHLFFRGWIVEMLQYAERIK